MLFRSGDKDTDIQNRLEDAVGEGEAGMKGERNIDIYTLPNVKWMASGKLLHSTGRSDRCLVTT